MQKSIQIPLNKKENKSYKIIIKPGVFEEIAQDLKDNEYGKKYCIITDTKVKKLYGTKLQKSLSGKKIKSSIIAFPSGEKNKNLQTYEKILEKMIKEDYKRGDCIIALGGGVVGDIAGFVAATFLRGINFVQIPTTLLAMTDSSIGGKTGVNSEYGKNLIGAFYQPKKVYIDPLLLKTLPEKEFKNGMAEVIKHACIKDKALFKYLENSSDQIKKVKSKAVTKMLYMSCMVKANIVKKDVKEKKLRMLLNYGHTIGHGLEKISNYEIPHGEAVAIGIHAINKLALRNQIISHKNVAAIKDLLTKYKLKTTIPRKLESRKILEVVKKDKKSVGKKLNLVFVTKIGKAVIRDDIAIKIYK